MATVFQHPIQLKGFPSEEEPRLHSCSSESTAPVVLVNRHPVVPANLVDHLVRRLALSGFRAVTFSLVDPGRLAELVKTVKDGAIVSPVPEGVGCVVGEPVAELLQELSRDPDLLRAVVIWRTPAEAFTEAACPTDRKVLWSVVPEAGINPSTTGQVALPVQDLIVATTSFLLDRLG